MKDLRQLPYLQPTTESLFRHFESRAGLPPEAIANHTGKPGKLVDNSTASAVLIPIYYKDDALRVLLTWRSEHLRAHAGQICFPGGRADDTDRDLRHTALRETHEEVGLPMEHVQILGRLGEYHTASGYCITPFVGFINNPTELVPNPHEVAAVLEPPLQFFMQPTIYELHTREVQDGTHSYYVVNYDGYVIWGATCAMIVELYRQLAATHKQEHGLPAGGSP